MLTALGFEQRTTLVAEAWSQEAVATAAIEGERLDLLAVWSFPSRIEKNLARGFFRPEKIAQGIRRGA